MAKLTEAEVKQKAKDLLAELSLEEKMGQVRGIWAWPESFAKQLGMTYEQLQQGLMKQYPTGAGNVSTLFMRSMETTEECAEFQRTWQKLMMDAQPHHIPAIFHMEGLCGPLFQGTTSFPSGYARGASWDPDLERKIGRIVGRQERAMGITETLAPVLDVSRDTRFGRVAETMGEDPTLIAEVGSSYVEGLQEDDGTGRHTESVAKHFLAFHHSSGGIHGTDCNIGERELREIYGKPFQAAFTEAGLRGIMPCYDPVNGEPESVSKRYLNDLLRGEMGFDGLTVSDYGALSNAHNTQNLYETDAETGLAGLIAGMDQELPNTTCYNDELMEMFRSGKADIALLDTAVLHVLEAKIRMGLFEHPFAEDGEDLLRMMQTKEDYEVTLQSARESIVLLKNIAHGAKQPVYEPVKPARTAADAYRDKDKNNKDEVEDTTSGPSKPAVDGAHGVLPIDPAKPMKITVVGRLGSDPRLYFGGYTHYSMQEGMLASLNTMAGNETQGGPDRSELKTIPGTQIEVSDTPVFAETLHRQKPDVHDLVTELKNRLSKAEITYSWAYDFAGTDDSHFAEALEACRDADLVIAGLGGKNGTGSVASMGEGNDGVNINLPAIQDAFLTELEKLDVPVVGVHVDGRAISSDVADRVCDAILECWNPSEAGSEAIVDVLTGKVNPGGRLPLTVARLAGQLPMYYNHPNNSSWHQGGSIAFADYCDCPHTPRYFFGYGLSYTTFDYSDLAVDLDEAAGTITASVKVTNTGAVDGDEIVQLYFRDIYATCIRPVSELAGFRRVHLAAGETKTVTFTMKLSQLAMIDRDMNWKVEAGAFDIRIGRCSDDIALHTEIRVAEDHPVDARHRGFWAETSVN